MLPTGSEALEPSSPLPTPKYRNSGPFTPNQNMHLGTYPGNEHAL